MSDNALDWKLYRSMGPERSEYGETVFVNGDRGQSLAEIVAFVHEMNTFLVHSLNRLAQFSSPRL
jgi:hypothetical protein